MPKVLVAAASKYGATHEMAETIGATLRERGLEVDVLAPDDVRTVEGWDAVVLGSAVYAGRWMKQARELVERAGPALRERPVWLFSSGPIGDPPKPEEDPVDASPVSEATGAREHRVFAGRLVKKGLSLPDRAIATALRVAEGDFRDEGELRDWAGGIADALVADT